MQAQHDAGGKTGPTRCWGSVVLLLTLVGLAVADVSLGSRSGRDQNAFLLRPGIADRHIQWERSPSQKQQQSQSPAFGGRRPAKASAAAAAQTRCGDATAVVSASTAAGVAAAGSGDGAFRVLRRLWADTAAAVASSFCVAPIITIVDRSIVLTANGAASMGQSVQAGVRGMVQSPARFVLGKEFLWVWGLYGATFVAANMIATACDELQASSTLPKFFGTTAVNMPSCIAKDAAFARMFGAAGRAGAVPALSYALFTVRDCITIAAGFTLPESMSDSLRESVGWTKDVSDNVSQLLCPGLMQFITTPLHLLGLDLYNNPGGSFRPRCATVSKNYMPSLVLRFGRVGAAFGIGGVANKAIRDALQPPSPMAALPVLAA